MIKNLFKFFSSIKLGVISLLLLAFVLATATFVESYYGMRAVHVMIYGTPWFGGVLFLLGLNVFCAALSRYPWKKHQTGFVITHLGIIVLLVGSWITQQWGIDANIPVGEGTKNNQVIESTLKLSVEDQESEKSEEYTVSEFGRAKEGTLLKVEIQPGKSLIVDQFYPRALFNRTFKKSPLDKVGNPAIKIKLYNDRFEVVEWISLSHPGKKAELNLGPALVTFQKNWTFSEQKEFLNPPPKIISKKEIGFIEIEHQGKILKVNIEGAMNKWYSIPQSDLKIFIERYLPYAIVEKNQLITRSQEPLNPAVQLRLRQAGFEEEKHTLFANFPEFSTMHGAKSKKTTMGAKLKMISTAEVNNPKRQQGKLLLAESFNESSLLYRVLGRDGSTNGSGEIKIGEEKSTGWMDLKFEVVEWIPNAVEDTTPLYVDQISGSDNYYTAVHIKEDGVERPTDFWLYEGMGKSITLGGRDLSVQFKKQTFQLPFDLYLKKFTMGTNPGTRKAASYQSEVLILESGKQKESALISMNEPLKYGGYTFYQASYQMEDGRPPTSVFAVNYDPGRWVKYLGSLLIVIGASVMFWMNPHYWGIILGRKNSK